MQTGAKVRGCGCAGRNDSLPKPYEIQQRRRATEYLNDIADSHPNGGRFVVAKLHKGGKDITVHSKVLSAADDQSAWDIETITDQNLSELIGSVNRSTVQEVPRKLPPIMKVLAFKLLFPY